MHSSLIPGPVQHDSGLWEASAVLGGELVHFGFFSEQEEAQRTLDAALARFGGQTGEPEGS
jgi:hypothetical protein